MHDTVIKMKDGRTFCGPMWSFRPEEGWMSIPSDEDAPDRIYFRDMESCVTKGQRVGIDPETKQAIIRDEDELERARRQGWDGT